MSGVKVEIGQVWLDEDGKRWKVRAFSKRGWPVVSRFGYRTASAYETNPGWFEKWTLQKPAPEQSPQVEEGTT